MPASIFSKSGCYCITLFTHGQRALLTNGSPYPLRGGPAVPTSIGHAAITTWQTLLQDLPQLNTEAFYLMPSSLCIIVSVQNGAEDTLTLRLLHDAVRRLKDVTTRRYNSSSAQDYRSRLWQTAFSCKPVATSGEFAALNQQMAAQGAYLAI